MERVFNEIKVCKGVHTGELQSHFFPGCARNMIPILSMSVFLGRFNLTPSTSASVLLPRFVYARTRPFVVADERLHVRTCGRPSAPKLYETRRGYDGSFTCVYARSR